MSFSFSPGMGPRGAIRHFSGEAKQGRFFNRVVVRGMLAFLRPYRLRMTVAIVLMLAVTGLTLLAPYLMKIAIDDYIAAGNTDGLAQIALYTGLTFLGLFVATAVQQYILGWVGQRVLADLRAALFRHLQALPLNMMILQCS